MAQPGATTCKGKNGNTKHRRVAKGAGGRATEAILLKPENAKGKLPGLLAFHDHSGDKYFGIRKITKISDQQHPLMTAHQKQY